MPRYDTSSYEPPAPVALVTLRNPHGSQEVSGVPMLIDSGADVSLVPSDPVGRLGVETEAGKSYQLVGFDGTESLAVSVNLHLIFAKRVFRGQFLITDQDTGVLGRNVLNALKLILDGPRLDWEISR